MQGHTGIGRKWRRFNRKYGSHIAVCVIVLFVMALVGLIMYALYKSR